MAGFLDVISKLDDKRQILTDGNLDIPFRSLIVCTLTSKAQIGDRLTRRITAEPVLVVTNGLRIISSFLVKKLVLKLVLQNHQISFVHKEPSLRGSAVFRLTHRSSSRISKRVKLMVIVNLRAR